MYLSGTAQVADSHRRTSSGPMPSSDGSKPTSRRIHWQRVHPAHVGLALVLLYSALSGLHRASEKLFWFDEIATVAVARQETPTGIWNALREAADSQPPPYYLLEALSGRLPIDPHISYRLPSLLGFLGTPIALWCFVGKRRGKLAALAAALMPFVTPLFTDYAIETRPYALMTCCLAWALVMWQDADRRGRAAAMALFLVAASSVSYTAVVALVPLGIAELARAVRVREFRVRVWLALMAASVPVAAFWPLLSGFKQEYGGAFWSQPQLLDTYGQLLGISARWAAPLVAVLVAAWIASLVPQRRPGREIQQVPPEEHIVILAFVGLPVVIYVVAVALQSPLVSRYVLPTILGVSVAAAFLVSTSKDRTVVWYLAALLSIFGLQQTDYWRFGRIDPGGPSNHSDLDVLRRLVQRTEETGLPIVVSNGLRYLAMAYYGGAATDLRFFYLPDPAGAARFTRTDSVDVAVLKLAPYMPMRLQEPSSFFATHRVFLLFSENELWDFLPRRLVREGHSLRLLTVDGTGGANHMLYRVELQGS